MILPKSPVLLRGRGVEARRSRGRDRFAIPFFPFLNASDTMVMGTTSVPREADQQNLVLQRWAAVLEEKSLGTRKFTGKRMKLMA